MRIGHIITAFLLVAFAPSALAWEDSFDTGSSGTPYNAMQFFLPGGGSVSFGATATAAGWQVVETVATAQGTWVIAKGPTSTAVADVNINGSGILSLVLANFVWQKWYIDADLTAQVKTNHYIDRVTFLGSVSLGGGWFQSNLSLGAAEWHGSPPSSTVADGGPTLALLGIALIALVTFSQRRWLLAPFAASRG